MTSSPGSGSSWPDQFRPGALRWARTSGNFDATIAFYRDLLGLAVVGEFHASFGEDGIIFGLPDTTVQMEIVRAKGPVPAADPLDLLVFYLDDAAAVAAATEALQAAGVSQDPNAHPYWIANRAQSYLDPDGRGVVFAPWVYGRDPEPSETPNQPS